MKSISRPRLSFHLFPRTLNQVTDQQILSMHNLLRQKPPLEFNKKMEKKRDKKA